MLQIKIPLKDLCIQSIFEGITQKTGAIFLSKKVVAVLKRKYVIQKSTLHKLSSLNLESKIYKFNDALHIIIQNT